LSHKIIDSGAHVILGHHPHVLQGIEKTMAKYRFTKKRHAALKKAQRARRKKKR